MDPPSTEPEPTLPSEVVSAYDLQAASAHYIPSLINRTFRALDSHGRQLILQRLHPVFSAEINQNILAVTRRLVSAGLETPELVATTRGRWWLEGPDGIWRAQTFVEGEVVQRIESPELAHNAAALVARFHGALWSWNHQFSGLRSGVHDTKNHLTKLQKARAVARTRGDHEVVGVAERILTLSSRAVTPFDGLPVRICHGDLKASNVLFHPKGAGYPRARCLIDLDTLGPGWLAYELGDALRSWCNTAGEDAPSAHFSQEIFEAAVHGYASSAPSLLDRAEWRSVVPGLLTVAVELAARFCVDAVEDCYFGWDPARFASRRDHNLARSRVQLDLACTVEARMPDLLRLAERP